jgi:hypothetical protein
MMTITIDSEQLTRHLRDPLIVRIVSIIDVASLSILELLEYNLTRNDINYALSNGIIAVNKSVASSSAYEDTQHIEDLNILVSGDYYFHNFLSSIVKLTDVGLHILGSIRGIEKQWNNDVILPKDIEEQKQQQRSDFSSYSHVHMPNYALLANEGHAFCALASQVS